MTYIVIGLIGGLGNQLFEISNAYQLSIKFNKQLIIWKDNPSTGRGVYWETILRHFKKYLVSKGEFMELRKKCVTYSWAKTKFHYKEINLKPEKNYYIEGFYQSYKYFDIKLFEPLIHFNDVQLNVRPSDIAIHIRRTDYVSGPIHKCMKMDYYYNGIQHILNKIGKHVDFDIYVFSDDIKWCRNNFKYNDIIPKFVNMKTDIEEMAFMTSFRNIVIANSTFSWWCAYLNNVNMDKIVVAPKHWFSAICKLETQDIRPPYWDIIDDDLVYKKDGAIFDKNIFNVVSLGSACCMKQNIHDNIYKHLGQLFHQKENATDFFDWLICDFRSILYVFDQMVNRSDTFINNDNFTFEDIQCSSSKLTGGWKKVYRKVELIHKDNGALISLHDVDKSESEVPATFFDKYKRRLDRLMNKIKNNNDIHFTHCIDFQWLSPYFPSITEIDKFIEYCKAINLECIPTLHLFIHPMYHNKEIVKTYETNDYVRVCLLKSKGYHSDWKADNLTFNEFLYI